MGTELNSRNTTFIIDVCDEMRDLLLAQEYIELVENSECMYIPTDKGRKEMVQMLKTKKEN
jgi:hypothetical protein